MQKNMGKEWEREGSARGWFLFFQEHESHILYYIWGVISLDNNSVLFVVTFDPPRYLLTPV